MNDRQHIEMFHLLFLDWFGRKVDKGSYALKGGCNLRFFFGSIRYSEQVDLSPEEQARYADPHVWDSMVLNVAEAL